MKRKAVVFLLALAMSASTVQAADIADVPDAINETAENASAENTDQDFKELKEEAEKTANGDSGFSLFGASLDDIFSNMEASLMSGQSVSFSDAVGKGIGMEIPSDNLFDISMTSLADSIDGGMVNLQYLSLVNAMTDNYDANMVNLGGQSQDCISIFQNTYGGVVEGLSLETPKIPDGFSVQSMLDSSSTVVNNSYSEAMGSSMFTTAKENISIGDIFSTANKGLSMPDLASSDALSSMMASSSAKSKLKAMDEFNTSSANSGLSSVYDLKERANRAYLDVVDLNNSVVEPQEGETAEDNAYKMRQEMKNLSGSFLKDLKHAVDNAARESTKDKKNDIRFQNKLKGS